MDMSRAAASGAASQSCQFGFSRGGKGANLLVPDMYPLDLIVLSDRIVKFIKAVAGHCVNASDTSPDQHFYELLRYFF
jgi:hypothetical protein